MGYFLHDEKHNRIEGLSKEQIYDVLAAAIQSGELPLNPDQAFITQIKSDVDNKTYKIAFCTNAKYLELKAAGELIEDCLYIITDEDPYTDLANAIDSLQANVTYIIEPALQNHDTRITALENKFARTEHTITIGASGAELELDAGIYVFYTGNYSNTYILNIRSKEYYDSFYYSTPMIQFVNLSVLSTALRYDYNESLGSWRIRVMRGSIGGETSIDGGTFNFYKL